MGIGALVVVQPIFLFQSFGVGTLVEKLLAKLLPRYTWLIQIYSTQEETKYILKQNVVTTHFLRSKQNLEIMAVLIVSESFRQIKRAKSALHLGFKIMKSGITNIFDTWFWKKKWIVFLLLNILRFHALSIFSRTAGGKDSYSRE